MTRPVVRLADLTPAQAAVIRALIAAKKAADARDNTRPKAA